MRDALKPRQKLEIHKYPNRRYYDRTRSRHVRLEEIYDLIRAGHDVQITDSKTSEDITAKVLAQIILEHDPPKLDAFPSELLHRLIRANEQLVNDFISKYFNHALAAFIDSQRQFDEYLRHAVGLSGDKPGPGFPSFLGMPFPSPLFGMSPPGDSDQPATADAKPTPQKAEPADEVETLRRTVNRLNRQVEDLERALRERSH